MICFFKFDFFIQLLDQILQTLHKAYTNKINRLVGINIHKIINLYLNSIINKSEAAKVREKEKEMIYAFERRNGRAYQLNLLIN